LSKESAHRADDLPVVEVFDDLNRDQQVEADKDERRGQRAEKFSAWDQCYNFLRICQYSAKIKHKKPCGMVYWYRLYCHP
jgi:hypothetical protein